MIDWKAPIEAVHTDGRIEAITLCRTDHTVYGKELTRSIRPRLDGGRTHWFNEDGSHRKGEWTIRNVEPTLRTSDEALRRMEALVERMANSKTMLHGCDYEEARAIQALRTPIDPRLEPVVRSLVANGISEPVARLYARDVLKALDAASC